MTRAQKTVIEQLADDRGLSTAEFVRSIIFKPVKPVQVPEVPVLVNLPEEMMVA
jgi:hypothetical protein